jgi:hypothetical protein
MRTCLQGVRDYNDALKDGRIAGPNAEEIVDAIARYSVTKDRDLIRTVIPAALHPDGEVNVDGLVRKGGGGRTWTLQGRHRMRGAPLAVALRTGAPIPNFMVYIVPISLQLLLG